MSREEVIARILQTDASLRPVQIDELRTAELAMFERNQNSLPGLLLSNLRNELLRRDRQVPEPPPEGTA